MAIFTEGEVKKKGIRSVKNWTGRKRGMKGGKRSNNKERLPQEKK